MSFTILSATTKQEKEAIYRFRYKVYIEELKKNHIEADHQHKMMFDEADKNSILFYAVNNINEIIGTVRLIAGKDGFPDKLIEYFGVERFLKEIPLGELAIIDRLMVASSYRNLQLGHSLSLATFFEGPKLGIRLVFMTSDERVMPMHLHYGWRCYTEPVTIAPGKRRFNFIFFTKDYAYLKKIRSPFLPHIQTGLLNVSDDYVDKVKALLGYDLYTPKLRLKQVLLSESIKYYRRFINRYTLIIAKFFRGGISSH